MLVKNHITLLTGTILLGLAYTPAWAQDTPTADLMATTPAKEEVVVPAIPISAAAKDIMAINERVALLSAELAELEIKAQIAAKNAEIEKLDSDFTSSPTSFTSMGQNSVPVLPLDPVNLGAASMVDPGIPTVTSVQGVDDQMKATLSLGQGQTQSVQVGDRVGGFEITEITVHRVTARSGKRSVILPFSDSSSTQAGTNTSNNGLNTNNF
jgi:type IV pilus biogenesis protein PilP